tara:strand:- start:2395 stop:3846 length:1452 start_codon:yes stop_codon:yes gene_type:complete
MTQPNNNGEIIVKTLNLYVNSNDRSRSSQGGHDSGKISIPFKNISDFSAGENQHLRITLNQFTCNNSFDRCISPNNSFQMYIGSSIRSTANLTSDGVSTPVAVTGGTLISCQLLLPRYDAYSDITLDLANSLGIGLNPIYPSTAATNTTSGFEYKIVRNSGNGRSVPSTSTNYLICEYDPAIGSPSIPNNYGNIGYYQQSGEKILTTVLQIRNKSGAFPQTNWDNTANETALGLFFGDNNDTYIQTGAKPTTLSSFSTFLAEATKCATGAILEANGSDFDLPESITGLGGMFGNVAISTTSSTNDTLTISFSSRCPLQLNTESLLYLRSNLVSRNHCTSNMNETQSTPDPQDTESSNLLAAFPINSDVIYYQNSGADIFQMDILSRSIQNLELFLTDKHGNVDWRTVPYRSTTSYTSNISFTALFKLQIIESPVINKTNTQEEMSGMPPPRFTSNVLNSTTGGRDFTTNNNTTKMASLQFSRR